MSLKKVAFILCGFAVLTLACDTKTKAVDACGDGFLDPGEACDGANLDDMTCSRLGLGGGTLACKANCKFDVSRCELAAECGDNVAASPYEPCDGTDLDDQTCETLGFHRGTLACQSDCAGFDTSGCTNCGNGAVDDGEQCDGTNLNQATCASLGYSGGALSCTTGCVFDFTACEAPVTCGNGQLDDDEQCDGALLNGETCQTRGFFGGQLGCRPNCAFDTTGCTNCGNGVINTGETCDGANLDGQTCVTQGWYGGTLTCAADCLSFNDSSCIAAGRCGDGTIQATHGEDCEGTDLGSGTCFSEGFYEGTLSCGSDCRYVTSGCTGRCGDGTIQATHGEECEGSNLAGATCESLGYSPRSGALGCTSACQFNEAACAPISSNANLSSLTVSSGTLSPNFSSSTTSYSVTVPLAVTSMTITGTAADAPWATVAVTPTQPMTLAEGTNPATVRVTAEDGTQKTYTVTVTRQTTLDYTSPNIGTLIYVPSGTFQRDATATNLSTVSAFRMSKHEITRAQWTAVTGWADPSNPTYSSGMNDPVQQVSWYDAIAFCNKLSLAEGLTPVYTVNGVNFSTLTYAQIPTATNADWNAATANWSADGYRLPTEMEWMWAAMGADLANPGAVNTTGWAKAFAGSTGSNLIGDYAVFGYSGSETGRTTTQRSNPVGSKLANELGFHDLSGNIWEWAWDWYAASYPSGTLTDLRGPASGSFRVRRGGFWFSFASYCTVAVRSSSYPDYRSYYIGFRVVRP